MPHADSNSPTPPPESALQLLNRTVNAPQRRSIDIFARYTDRPNKCVADKVKSPHGRCGRQVKNSSCEQDAANDALVELASLNPENNPETCAQLAERLSEICLCRYHNGEVKKQITEWREQSDASDASESEGHESGSDGSILNVSTSASSSTQTLNFSDLDEPSPVPNLPWPARVPSVRRPPDTRGSTAPPPYDILSDSAPSTQLEHELQAILDRQGEDDSDYEPSSDEDESQVIHTPPTEPENDIRESVEVDEDEFEDETEYDFEDREVENEAEHALEEDGGKEEEEEEKEEEKEEEEKEEEPAREILYHSRTRSVTSATSLPSPSRASTPPAPVHRYVPVQHRASTRPRSPLHTPRRPSPRRSTSSSSARAGPSSSRSPRPRSPFAPTAPSPSTRRRAPVANMVSASLPGASDLATLRKMVRELEGALGMARGLLIFFEGALR